MAQNKKKQIDSFVNSCSMVFKSYQYEVVISKNKANLWHYTAAKKGKKYVVYCAPELSKVKGIIKIALKKVPKDSRLVVICSNHSDEEHSAADDSGYTLVTLDKIKKYGAEMIDALSDEA